MSDHHLNIFRSYNHSLIENNLTRAFIVVLRFLSPEYKNVFLKTLFNKKKFKDLDFRNIEFALQGNIPIPIEKILKIPNKFAIALIGLRHIENLELFNDPETFNKQIEFNNKNYPWNDAWIFDGNLDAPGFCFMFECKGIGDILNAEQIITYSKEYLGFNNFTEFFDKHEIITWYDVYDVCESLLNQKLSNFESCLLKDFIEYLEMNNVIPYRGLNFDTISDLPEYNFLFKSILNFQNLADLPDFKFKL